jgi:hypothetical protein
MKKSDVPGHRTRSRAVYYTIAMEMISKPLHQNLNSFTDVITIIEMRGDSKVIILMEPITWNLYNKIVQLADKPIKDI